MSAPEGFYCSTSGTVFADKDALTDHYKSDLHRYNLKRKVAGACRAAGAPAALTPLAGGHSPAQRSLAPQSAPRAPLRGRARAGLPPVTREWFEARKEQLASMQTTADAPSLWVCPLTHKKFKTEATYVTHTGTKAFRAAMKAAGLTAAPPAERRAITKRAPEAAQPAPAAEEEGAESGWETDDEMGDADAEVRVGACGVAGGA